MTASPASFPRYRAKFHWGPVTESASTSDEHRAVATLNYVISSVEAVRLPDYGGRRRPLVAILSDAVPIKHPGEPAGCPHTELPSLI